jgi:magnesium-transporting ATPase (P-type)
LAAAARKLTLRPRSVICTDKTGTLTKGEMTAVRFWQHGDLYKVCTLPR